MFLPIPTTPLAEKEPMFPTCYGSLLAPFPAAATLCSFQHFDPPFPKIVFCRPRQLPFPGSTGHKYDPPLVLSPERNDLSASLFPSRSVAPPPPSWIRDFLPQIPLLPSRTFRRSLTLLVLTPDAPVLVFARGSPPFTPSLFVLYSLFLTYLGVVSIVPP